MIMLLLLKGLGLVEYMLDYLVVANITVTKDASSGQWLLNQVYMAPTIKGWAILDDLWTLIHNVMDMLAQFSTVFPLSNAGSYGVGYTTGNSVVGFTSQLNHP